MFRGCRWQLGLELMVATEEPVSITDSEGTSLKDPVKLKRYIYDIYL